MVRPLLWSLAGSALTTAAFVLTVNVGLDTGRSGIHHTEVHALSLFDHRITTRISVEPDSRDISGGGRTLTVTANKPGIPEGTRIQCVVVK